MSNKKENVGKFHEYFYKRLSREEIYNKNKINQIDPNKAFLFRNFIIGLLTNIEDTYLETNQQKYYKFQKDHFDWCWNKNIESFKNEGIYFFEEGEHYDYFLDYLIETFYSHTYPNEEIKSLKNFWSNIMFVGSPQTENAYEIFLDTYLIMQNHLKNDSS